MAATGFLHTAHVSYGIAVPLGLAPRAARATSDIWFYLVVLVALAVVLIVVGLIVRKHLAGPIESSDGGSVFSLSDLRRLHREGHLSDQEFQAARAIVLTRGNTYLNDKPPPPPAAGPASRQQQNDPDNGLGPELLDRSRPTDAPGPGLTPDSPDESDNHDGDPSDRAPDDST